MTRKELLSCKERKGYEPLKGVSGVYVIPNGKKHESGYACMTFVAEFKNGKDHVRFGGVCDDISFEGLHFRMDCEYPSRIIHIWNSRGTFTVRGFCSSIDFEEDGAIKK